MELFLDEMKMKNPKLEKNKLFLINNLRMSVVEVVEWIEIPTSSTR
jgi:hypothetical protein